MPRAMLPSSRGSHTPRAPITPQGSRSILHGSSGDPIVVEDQTPGSNRKNPITLDDDDEDAQSSSKRRRTEVLEASASKSTKLRENFLGLRKLSNVEPIAPDDGHEFGGSPTGQCPSANATAITPTHRVRRSVLLTPKVPSSLVRSKPTSVARRLSFADPDQTYTGSGQEPSQPRQESEYIVPHNFLRGSSIEELRINPDDTMLKQPIPRAKVVQQTESENDKGTVQHREQYHSDDETEIVLKVAHNELTQPLPTGLLSVTSATDGKAFEKSQRHQYVSLKDVSSLPSHVHRDVDDDQVSVASSRTLSPDLPSPTVSQTPNLQNIGVTTPSNSTSQRKSGPNTERTFVLGAPTMNPFETQDAKVDRSMNARPVDTPNILSSRSAAVKKVRNARFGKSAPGTVVYRGRKHRSSKKIVAKGIWGLTNYLHNDARIDHDEDRSGIASSHVGSLNSIRVDIAPVQSSARPVGIRPARLEVFRSTLDGGRFRSNPVPFKDVLYGVNSWVNLAAGHYTFRTDEAESALVELSNMGELEFDSKDKLVRFPGGDPEDEASVPEILRNDERQSSQAVSHRQGVSQVPQLGEASTSSQDVIRSHAVGSQSVLSSVLQEQPEISLEALAQYPAVVQTRPGISRDTNDRTSSHAQFVESTPTPVPYSNAPISARQSLFRTTFGQLKDGPLVVDDAAEFDDIITAVNGKLAVGTHPFNADEARQVLKEMSDRNEIMYSAGIVYIV
ncbi:hypothetical protein P153DRAFT_412614 [Dothidotthia symphoricarpi CBS 119687]|uniref:MCM3-like winged helix domain-containing protein n=1 Tax=Dothidotthia symphoricarpi CBS 119687 TaxID=1392245 RepID=A0A6A5ZW16_9PLEO|nr:uncharacterized protein P153DRAFT_412614 [Dothidotthia symphoricarpi CBS 119687]KAF2123719.1 hypothetical protein P153DRAFT_412614 [Dothidotthia symphoricarpi CBS 119687]